MKYLKFLGHQIQHLRHIWTPWFGIYGANSGFNSLEECFGDLSRYVYGIETGISSDPAMNWQIKELESRSILSFSDAHSLPKMGREATIFRLEKLSFENIRQAIMAPSLLVEAARENFVQGPVSHSPSSARSSLGLTLERTARLTERPASATLQSENFASFPQANKILYAIEFYSEEGKYHYSGHRNCHLVRTPEEIKMQGVSCPVCNKNLTDGVMRRVEELANLKFLNEYQTDSNNLVWIKDQSKLHPPFIKLVPLREIIAQAIGSSVGSKKVKVLFDHLCQRLGSEINVLLKTALIEIAKISSEKIAQGVDKVRQGEIMISPGYDGLYGKVAT